MSRSARTRTGLSPMTGSVMKATGGLSQRFASPRPRSITVRPPTRSACSSITRRRTRVRPSLTGEVAAAWQGKELLRAVYAAVGMPAARAALERFSRWADSVGVVELSRLARTIRAWQAEILAWHVTDGCFNGPTEAVNLLIKKIKRIGRLS
jgi:transposase